MSRHIFLSGVHGVGKGYFISNKLAKIKNLTVISASEIISRYHNAEDAGNKRVKNFGDNQKILLDALVDYFAGSNETILLDGHLVILDSQDKIQRIPDAFFASGMFDTLIVLQDDPNLILERLYKRDGIHKLSIDLICQIQENEKKYAYELRKRGIEVNFITPSSEDSMYIKYFL